LSTLSQNHRRRLAVYAGVFTIGTIGLAATLVVRSSAGDAGYVPDPSSLSAQGRTIDLSTVRVRGIIQSAEFSWNVVSYQSSDGLCLEVDGQTPVTGEQGSVTSCGPPEDSLVWAQGGVALEDQWFSVMAGFVPSTTVGLRMTLRDGTVLDGAVANGVWLGVVPTNPKDPTRDPVLVEAVDASGGVVASYEPPALSDYQAAMDTLSATEPPLDK
jgi:hypothetical protein